MSKKKDGGVRKSIIQPGIGDEHPCEGCHCTGLTKQSTAELYTHLEV